MTQDELISQQAMEIADLNRRVKDYERRMTAITMTMVSIGGPLNDNKLSYSREQLGPFFRIRDLSEPC